MATTKRPTAEQVDTSSEVTAAVREADLVHLVSFADADCLCAAGIFARTCLTRGVPYHVSVAKTAADFTEQLARMDTTTTPITIGSRMDAAVGLDPAGPVSLLAYDLSVDLSATPDPETALAGAVAAGAVPSRVAPDLLEVAGVERQAGVGVPTVDLADGLAHTGLVHAEFSGDLTATRNSLAAIGLSETDGRSLDEGDARRVASLLALTVAGDPDASTRAATAVQRAIGPYTTAGPFGTVAGHADVLDALAMEAPGLAVALTVGEDGHADAIDSWREHGRAVHDAVRAAETARYRGLIVARTDGPVARVARLFRDFRSPEPIVLALGKGEAAVASVETSVAGPLGAAAEAGNGSSIARGCRGYATFDPDRTERVIEAFRGAL